MKNSNVVSIGSPITKRRTKASLGRTKTDASAFLGTPLPESFQIQESDQMELLEKGDMEVLMLERAPFFFIDRAVALSSEASGYHTVWGLASMTEERSAGHFPGLPIVPLIELCKSMAQTGIILVSLSGQEHQVPIAISSGPSKAVARELVGAPVQVLVKVTLVQSRLRLFFVDGTAHVNGKIVGTLKQIIYTLMAREELLPKF